MCRRHLLRLMRCAPGLTNNEQAQLSLMKKKSRGINVSLTQAQKKKAVAHIFSGMISSFKIEGINFSPEQQEKLKSRLDQTI